MRNSAQKKLDRTISAIFCAVTYLIPDYTEVYSSLNFLPNTFPRSYWNCWVVCKQLLKHCNLQLNIRRHLKQRSYGLHKTVELQSISSGNNFQTEQPSLFQQGDKDYRRQWLDSTLHCWMCVPFWRLFSKNNGVGQKFWQSL